MNRLRRLGFLLRPILLLLGSAAGEGKSGTAIGVGVVGALGVGKLLNGAEHAAVGAAAAGRLASGAEHLGSAAMHSASAVEHLAPAASLERASLSSARGLEVPTGMPSEPAHLTAEVHAPVPEAVPAAIAVSSSRGASDAVRATPVSLVAEGTALPATPAVRATYQRRAAPLVEEALARARHGGKISRQRFAASLNDAIARSSDPALLAASSRVDPRTGRLALHFTEAGHEFRGETDAFELLENVLSTGNDLLSLVPDPDDSDP